MKKLPPLFLVIVIMLAVVMFSDSPSWAYPNPFQAFAAQEQFVSTPTITTANDQSPPYAAIIDWNYQEFDPHVGVAASSPVSTLSGQWTLVIGDCYPNPFSQSSGAAYGPPAIDTAIASLGFEVLSSSAISTATWRYNGKLSLQFAKDLMDNPQTQSRYEKEVRFVYIGNKVLIIDVATPMINMINGGGAPAGTGLALHGGPKPTSGIGNGGCIDVPYVYLGKLPAVQNGLMDMGLSA